MNMDEIEKLKECLCKEIQLLLGRGGKDEIKLATGMTSALAELVAASNQSTVINNYMNSSDK